MKGGKESFKIESKSLGVTRNYLVDFEGIENFILNQYNQNDSSCKVRTYERGVEDETLSCGTGAVAVAIALNYLGIENSNEIKISMKGGDLLVSFNRNEDRFYDMIAGNINIIQGIVKILSQRLRKSLI